MGGQLRPLPGAPGMFTGETVAMATGASGRGRPASPPALKEERKITGRATTDSEAERREQRQVGAAVPPLSPAGRGDPSLRPLRRGRRWAHAPLRRIACREL